MNSYKIKGMYSSKLKIFLMLCILFRPEIINQYVSLDNIVNVLRIILCFIIWCDYFLRKKISKFFLIQLLVWSVYNIHCLKTQTWDFNIFSDMIRTISIVCMVEGAYRENKVLLFDALRYMLLLYFICNTITIILGFGVTELFLGFDNDVIMLVMPLL